MELCQKLSYLRVELSMSQFTVAEALHVSRQAISQWERGEVLPSLENLIHLSKLYQISLDELLNNRAEPPFQPPITRPLPQKPAEPEKVEPGAGGRARDRGWTDPGTGGCPGGGSTGNGGARPGGCARAFPALGAAGTVDPARRGHRVCPGFLGL